MSTKFIVECPDCKVRFFVTEELLATAYGVLRCGFCSHVFNGKDHIVYQTFDPRPKKETPVVPDAAVADKPQDASISITQRSDEPLDYWSEVVDTLSSFSVDFKNVEDNIETVVDDRHTVAEEDAVLAANSNVDINHVDEDIVDRIEHIDFDQLLTLDEKILSETNVDVPQPFEEEVFAKESTDSVLSPIEPNSDEGEPKDIYGNSLKKVSYTDFALDEPPSSKRSKSTIVWGFLSLLAMLFLAGQYIRFIAPEMALKEDSRAMAVTACKFLWCDIPPLVDVAKIKTNQLVVSESQTLENVLNVDAIIESKLSIAQPYPVVELRFTDLNGQPIASRRFSPREYLGGEVMQQNQMQPNVPTYISFEVIDPGEMAVGYSLYYYPDK